MGMTIAEKIIAAAAGVDSVKPGDIHTVKLDRLMSNDGTTHLTVDMYNNKLKNPHIADTSKLVFIVDHNVPSDSPKTAASQKKMRDFAKEHNIDFWEGKGVCHQVMIENYVRPGELIFGADSHTCSYGALGAFGTGVGCTDFLYGMVTGTSWVLVPESVKFNLTGKLPEGVYARDLILTIIGEIGANGCNYQAMEFTGEGAKTLSISDRMALCNMAVEAGAKTGIFEADEKAIEYLKEHVDAQTACVLIQHPNYYGNLEDAQAKLAQTLETCWDEDRFIRGIREDGVIVGAKKDPEANMWLNPQSWSVISGFASKEQADTAMQSVADILDTPYGAKLLEPPYRHHYFDGALMHIFNPDTKENGGIFSQSQGWLILAEALLGHGNAAFRYFTESSPAAMNDKAEIRVMEPYVHGQFTESSASPYAGRAHVHWLTGTASTVMVGCVEGICGMRPDADGLAIRPSIPAEWDGMKMHKVFRGKQLNIIVQNPNHVESGVCALTLNGEALQGDYVPAEKLQDTNEIVVTLGK